MRAYITARARRLWLTSERALKLLLALSLSRAQSPAHRARTRRNKLHPTLIIAHTNLTCQTCALSLFAPLCSHCVCVVNLRALHKKYSKAALCVCMCACVLICATRDRRLSVHCNEALMAFVRLRYDFRLSQ